MTELNQERNWRQIVVITSSIPVSEYVIKINDDGQSFADAFLYRMESLFKLKMFDEILTLASTVLSYMESDSRLKSTSENLIIALRLTLVEVKVMTGGGDESICILTEIEKELSSKSQSQSQSKNSQSHQWLRVVKSLKVNHFIRQHQLRFAVAELSKIATMLEKSPDASLSSSEVIYSLITVFCLLARISVQVNICTIVKKQLIVYLLLLNGSICYCIIYFLLQFNFIYLYI